jgi:hypothetical protein
VKLPHGQDPTESYGASSVNADTNRQIPFLLYLHYTASAFENLEYK